MNIFIFGMFLVIFGSNRSFLVNIEDNVGTRAKWGEIVPLIVVILRW